MELIPDRIHAISWHGDSFTKCWPPDGCSRDLDGGETFSISVRAPTIWLVRGVPDHRSPHFSTIAISLWLHPLASRYTPHLEVYLSSFSPSWTKHDNTGPKWTSLLKTNILITCHTRRISVYKEYLIFCKGLPLFNQILHVVLKECIYILHNANTLTYTCNEINAQNCQTNHMNNYADDMT